MKKIVTDRKGKVHRGRIIAISTTYDCNIQYIWKRIQNVSTLVEICGPMAKFTSCSGEMPKVWKIGVPYSFRLFLYGIIPIGKHIIQIERIDVGTYEIQSIEYNKFVPVWNHLIKMEAISNNSVKYTDEIEIYAGCLTPIVAWWSTRFYKHRQCGWRKLVEKSLFDEKGE